MTNDEKAEAIERLTREGVAIDPRSFVE